MTLKYELMFVIRISKIVTNGTLVFMFTDGEKFDISCCC